MSYHLTSLHDYLEQIANALVTTYRQDGTYTVVVGDSTYKIPCNLVTPDQIIDVVEADAMFKSAKPVIWG